MKITEMLNEITKFPISIYELSDTVGHKIFIETPHKGKVEIPITEKHFKLFGSVTETSKEMNKIVKQIKDLESESVDFLIKQWLSNK